MAKRKTNLSAAGRAGESAPDLGGVVAEHDRTLADLGRQVDSLLARQEWIQSGLYDLSLSLAAERHENGAHPGAVTDRVLDYSKSLRAVREAVRRLVPRNATVIVASKGDDALIDLYGRPAWHFPQGPDGGYAGYYLPDGGGLIAHLEVLRARGGEYLLFPPTSLWWLETYPKFAQHLQRHYPLILDHPEKGAMFELRTHTEGAPGAWKARIGHVIDEYVAEVGMEPSVLDWDTGLDLKDLLPNQAVFTPPAQDSELPYLDDTADIVVVLSPDEDQLREACRVATHVAIAVDPAPVADGGQNGPDARPGFDVRIEPVSQDSSRTTLSSSIVIPTYNGREQLGPCLTALEETLPDSFVGEVIVVDDGSEADTQAFLAEWEESGSRLNLKVIRNSSNCGFTKSCNIGAAAATGDILVFLNDDTLPQLGWLSALLRAFHNYPNAGAVGGKLLYPDGSLQEAGNVIFNDGSVANFGRGDFMSDDPLYSYVREVDYCSAALLATPRELFEEIGGFDQRYRPAYYEDTDYCFAVREHGRTVLYQPQSVIVHTEGVTSGTDLKAGVKRYQVVNHSKFAQKWKRQLRDQPSPPDRYDLRVLHSLAIRGAGREQ